MDLDQDFKEFIGLLNANGVKYLVIGGYAVNHHGYPRYTGDIDFWIWLTKENIEKLLLAIDEFGFGSLGLTANDFTVRDNIIQLGYEPCRIDLLVDVDGVDFESCYKQRSDFDADGIPIHYLGLDDLIKAKKAAGRKQDLADAEQLERIQKKQSKK